MSNNRDTEVFQVLRRQVGQDRLVYLILAECRLILSKAQAPQPDRDVHFGAPNSGLQRIIVRSGESVQEFRDWRFSVSIGATVKAVPRSLLTYPVPIVSGDLRRQGWCQAMLYRGLRIGFFHIADDGLPAIVHMDVLDAGKLLTAITAPFKPARRSAHRR